MCYVDELSAIGSLTTTAYQICPELSSQQWWFLSGNRGQQGWSNRLVGTYYAIVTSGVKFWCLFDVVCYNGLISFLTEVRKVPFLLQTPLLSTVTTFIFNTQYIYTVF